MWPLPLPRPRRDLGRCPVHNPGNPTLLKRPTQNPCRLDVPRLSVAEQQWWRDNLLYLCCGKAGHLLSCPLKDAARQWVRGSWRASPPSHPLQPISLSCLPEFRGEGSSSRFPSFSTPGLLAVSSARLWSEAWASPPWPEPLLPCALAGVPLDEVRQATPPVKIFISGNHQGELTLLVLR